MAKARTIHYCAACGYESPKWLGQCPACQAWNSFAEHKETPASGHRASAGSKTGGDRPRRLSDVGTDEAVRWATGSAELDRVLGGGLVRGSLTLLGGDPGIGKSTLALQMAAFLGDRKVWYVSGEESASQIRQRAERLGIDAANVWVTPQTEVTALAALLEAEPPDLLLIDSIQTVYRGDLEPLPGSVTQIRESAAVFQRLAKQRGITTVLIGHVTKDGDLAGPRVLEHMVDTVVQFDGDGRTYRLLRSLKNRFGASGEIGVFRMETDGLKDVSQPSDVFLADYDGSVSGTALSVVLEGTRPIVIEVQALVVPATYGTPQRTATGYDAARVRMLLAVLEQRVKLAYANRDVFVNVAGGLKTTDTALDLAVCMALASAWLDRPLPAGRVFVGEVGLGGEIRAVPLLERRLAEAARAGYHDGSTPASDRIKDLPALVRSSFPT